MSISPWTQGDGAPPWTFALETDSSSLDITGLSTSDFSLVMINISNQQSKTATGVFSNLVAASGSNPTTIVFSPSSNDTSALGMYDMRIIVKKGTANQKTFKFGLWSNEP